MCKDLLGFLIVFCHVIHHLATVVIIITIFLKDIMTFMKIVLSILQSDKPSNFFGNFMYLSEKWLALTLKFDVYSMTPVASLINIKYKPPITRF